VTTYMVKIKYVDTSIQKGSIPGFSSIWKTRVPSVRSFVRLRRSEAILQ